MSSLSSAHIFSDLGIFYLCEQLFSIKTLTVSWSTETFGSDCGGSENLMVTYVQYTNTVQCKTATLCAKTSTCSYK